MNETVTAHSVVYDNKAMVSDHDSLHHLCNLHHSSHCNITMQTHRLYRLSHGHASSLKCTENTGCIFNLWSHHSCHKNFTMYGPQTLAEVKTITVHAMKAYGEAEV